MIPIAQPKFTKTSMPDNPLLNVPPASKGEPTPCAVPLAKRGEPTEGAIVNFGAQLVLVALASCVYPLLQAGEGGCVDGRTAVRPYDLPRGNCAGRTPCAPTTLSHAEIVQGELPFAPTTLSHAEIVQGERRSPLHPPFCGRGAGGEGKTQNGSTETDLATSASAIPNMPISPIPQKKPAKSTGA